MKIISVFLTSLFLLCAGCATTPVPLSNSSAGTYDPAIPSSYTMPSASKGSLVIIRDSGWLEGACKAVLSVDSNEIGYVHTSQELTVYLPPGQHEIYAEIGEHSACGTLRTSTIFRIAAGQAMTMDIHISGTSMTITPQNLNNTDTSY